MINATTNKSILEDTDVQRALSIVYSDGYNKALKEVKEYLKKKIITVKSTDYDSCWELLNEIINELFKEI